MRPCFKFNMKDAAKPVLSIYDEIGFWGVQASDFRAQLGAITAKEVTVEINSPGGDLFAGVAMYNMLKAAGKTVNVKVMGVAASAASLVAMAGDTIEMPKNTFMMVHNPMGVSMGNADDMRETAELLDRLGASMVQTYAARTGQPENAIAEMLAVDTWMTADEALAAGFATVVTEDIEATASFDMTKADLPAHIKAVYASATPPVEKTPEEIEAERLAQVEADRLAAEAALAANAPVATAVHAAAITAGLTEHADFLAVAASSLEDGNKRVAAAKEIVALGTFAKRPATEISALVRGGKTVVEARAAIMTAMAAEDVHTNTTKPAPTNTLLPGIKSPSATYAARAAAKQARKA